MSESKKECPEEIFRRYGGQLRMSEAIAHGITRYMLYALKDRGVIEPVTRGIYRLRELPPLDNPDLITVSLRFPNAVVCLISALAYHGITTQIPHEVYVAVPRDSRVPSLDYPPIRAHRFSQEAYKSGIETHLTRWRTRQNLQPRENPSRLLQVSQQDWYGCGAGSRETPQDAKQIQPR